MIAVIDFVGIVGGKSVQFLAGDKIPADVAKILGLAGKPELARTAKK